MSRKPGSVYRPRNLKEGEHRSPMHRFLGETKERGSAEPEYDQQYRTMWKAHELGFTTEGEGYGHCGKITKKGEAELARLIKKEGE